MHFITSFFCLRFLPIHCFLVRYKRLGSFRKENQMWWFISLMAWWNTIFSTERGCGQTRRAEYLCPQRHFLGWRPWGQHVFSILGLCVSFLIPALQIKSSFCQGFYVLDKSVPWTCLGEAYSCQRVWSLQEQQCRWITVSEQVTLDPLLSVEGYLKKFRMRFLVFSWREWIWWNKSC